MCLPLVPRTHPAPAAAHVPPFPALPCPQVGGWWYAMCLVSPAAGTYYYKNAERTEEFRLKMVTSDDEMTTDIVVEGECGWVAGWVGGQVFGWAGGRVGGCGQVA